LESAIIACTSLKSAIGLPNCLRSLAYATASTISRSATPTHTAAMCSRRAVQHPHRESEPLALLAEPVGGRHRYLVEGDIADMGALLAHLLFGLADADARQVGRHQEGRDALRPDPRSAPSP
jgi:hypothetical protein